MQPVRVVRYLQFYILLALATFLSLTPQPPSIMERVSDKLLHVLGYAALIVSAHIAHSPNRRHLLKVGLLLTLSILIEFAQYFIPGRSLSLLDMAANLAGLAAGTWLFALLHGRFAAVPERS